MFFLQFERDNAASVELDREMVIIGGRAGLDVTGTVEIFNTLDDTWQTVPELTLREPRYSFCAVPGEEHGFLFIFPSSLL